MLPLEDGFARRFYYLRLSVTDVCNFRCTYCLPDGYRPPAGRKSFLSLDEIRRVVTGFAAMGTRKVRLTGGEPSLRRDFTAIIETVANTPGIEKVAMTTNGYRLKERAREWFDAGLNALNVSVDSLDPRQFHQITGENKLAEVMEGIEAALEAGFKSVKINAVLLKGLNDHQLEAFLAWIRHKPIELRFIELMQTGEMDSLFRDHHTSGELIKQQLLGSGWVQQLRGPDDGPAQVFMHPESQGGVGLIMPYSKDFCAGTRPAARVEHDLVTLREALRGRVTGLLKNKRRRMAMFYDNNIAGNLGYLRQLCDVMERLGLEWASSVTFNVLTNKALMQRMFDSGCRALYVGLETFNPAALDDFNKPQNRLPLIRRALDDARDVGILVTAGMILSPQHDDIGYIRSLPARLRESGLHVPTFLAFETPFPGTPYFHRLAAQNEERLARGERALFLPGALLRDFTSYTLVVEPSLACAQDYVAAYRETLDEIYAPRRRLAKLLHDVPSFVRRGAWTGAMLDVGDMLTAGLPHAPGRTYLAGTDLAPPERVPLTEADFADEHEAAALLLPTPVTDASGRLLPQWAPPDESLRPVAPPRKKKTVVVS